MQSNALEPEDPGKFSVLVTAILLLIPSITRVPFFENFDEFKFLSLGSTMALVLYLAFASRHFRFGVWLFVFISAVGLRAAYSILIAHFGYNQDLILSIFESRFGTGLLIAPFLFGIFWLSKPHRFLQVAIAYAALVVICDFAIFTFIPGFISDELTLEVGVREPSARIMISMIPAIIFPGIAMAKATTAQFRQKAAIAGAFVCVVGAVHAFIITTSRTEIEISTLFFMGYLSILLPARMKRLLILVGSVLLVLLLSVILNKEELNSGRDYLTPVQLIWRVILTGVGATRDDTLRAIYSLPETFYASDYGLLTYFIRYGIIIGSALLFTLVLPLKYLFSSGRFLIWRTVFCLSVVFYAIIVPMLDYSSINGAFFLTACLFLMIKEKEIQSQDQHGLETQIPQVGGE